MAAQLAISLLVSYWTCTAWTGMHVCMLVLVPSWGLHSMAMQGLYYHLTHPWGHGGGMMRPMRGP